jgi:hypothetical protein
MGPQTKGNCGRARAAPSRLATLGHVSGTTARCSPGGAGSSRNSSTARGKHLGVFASPSPSSGGTQRDEPAQVGPVGGGYPKPTPLLSVRGCEWGSKPLSSNIHSTPNTGGSEHKFFRADLIRVHTFSETSYIISWNIHKPFQFENGAAARHLTVPMEPSSMLTLLAPLVYCCMSHDKPSTHEFKDHIWSPSPEHGLRSPGPPDKALNGAE